MCILHADRTSTVTGLMFAQTGIPLGQVVLNGRVSYPHITAVGD